MGKGMDAITSEVLKVAMNQQAQKVQANAALLREAKRSDAAVLQLLDAAKALEEPSAGGRSTPEGRPEGGKGSLVNFTA
jgi:hypothetical protein